jgi:hypothetical protein
MSALTVASHKRPSAPLPPASGIGLMGGSTPPHDLELLASQMLRAHVPDRVRYCPDRAGVARTLARSRGAVSFDGRLRAHVCRRSTNRRASR